MSQFLLGCVQGCTDSRELFVCTSTHCRRSLLQFSGDPFRSPLFFIVLFHPETALPLTGDRPRLDEGCNLIRSELCVGRNEAVSAQITVTHHLNYWSYLTRNNRRTFSYIKQREISDRK